MNDAENSISCGYDSVGRFVCMSQDIKERNAYLESEFEKLKKDYIAETWKVAETRVQIEQLRARVNLSMMALEYYADGKHFSLEDGDYILEDDGDFAKQTLKHIRGGGK